MHAVLVPVYLLLVTPITLSWWAVAGQALKDPRTMCKNPRRTRNKKSDICSNKSEVLQQIYNGWALGKKECIYQFRYRRWNCTDARMRKVLAKDTRETGFVNAMLAAGITFQVTRACTNGELLGCSCDRKIKNKKKHKKKQKGMSVPEGDWEWEGCGGENIKFGMKKSKEFLDHRYRRKRSDMKILVTLHNFSAGRMAIKNHMRTECKCHGLSGSCTLKTCWRKMPTFRQVGTFLKEGFDGAVKVIAYNDGQSFVPQGETIKPPAKDDLVYYEESPDFCLPNNTLGSFGTQGRDCDEASQHEKGCAIMCCNRGSKTQNVSEVKNCKCKFKWCCEVKCEQCNETRSRSTCL